MLPMKRILSFFIDAVVVLIPSYYASYKQPVIELKYLFSINFFFLIMVLSIISGKGTLGDRFLSLTTISVTTTPLSKLKLVLRNLTYCVYLFLLIDELLTIGIMNNILLIVTLLASYLPVFSKKNVYNQNMTALDIVFKTTIVEKPWNVA
jgi:hypothetical protein